jgi:hypothetical protein
MSDQVVPFPSADEGPEPLAREAELAAWVAAAYAAAPVPSDEAARACAEAVWARREEVERAAPAGGAGWWRHRWWWGGASAAALYLVMLTRPAVRPGVNGETMVAPGATPPLPGIHQTRFVVTLPAGARTVALVGDFNEWDPGATRLAPVGDHGQWEATVPLAPGRHVYAFVVDGVEWRVDPLAPQVPDAGFGPANALIVDDGP